MDEAVLCPGKALKVFDHDYSFLSDGRVIPHGIYDIRLDKGFLTLGDSHETVAFVTYNLKWWWFTYGIHEYPDATHILIFCDCGGANGYRHHLFKKLLQDLSRKTGLRITIVHYLPYCSKYNPIERMLFSQVHRIIKNTILTDIQQVKELMSKTRTSTGLTVIVSVVEKEYPIGLKSCKEDIDKKRIFKHPKLPDLSYMIPP